jgi:hypothetical protein
MMLSSRRVIPLSVHIKRKVAKRLASGECLPVHLKEECLFGEGKVAPGLPGEGVKEDQDKSEEELVLSTLSTTTQAEIGPVYQVPTRFSRMFFLLQSRDFKFIRAPSRLPIRVSEGLHIMQ